MLKDNCKLFCLNLTKTLGMIISEMHVDRVREYDSNKFPLCIGKKRDYKDENWAWNNQWHWCLELPSISRIKKC